MRMIDADLAMELAGVLVRGLVNNWAEKEVAAGRMTTVAAQTYGDMLAEQFDAGLFNALRTSIVETDPPFRGARLHAKEEQR